jgi:serine/threonine protein kinase
LGSGAFGKVLEVLDHKYSRHYALKILKVSDELYEQFKLEVRILKTVKEHASTNKNIVEIKGDFEFRGHIVSSAVCSVSSLRCLA